MATMHDAPPRVASDDAGPADAAWPAATRIDARTPEQACELAGRVFHAHRLQLPAGGDFGLAMRSVAVGPITVGTLRYASMTAIDTDEYGSAYQVNQSFGAPVRTSSGGERVALGGRWAAVYRPDRPTAIVGWEAPATMLGVKIDRAAFERFHAAYAGDAGGEVVPFGLRLDTSSPAGEEWVRSVRRLVRWGGGGAPPPPAVRDLLVEGCLAALACAAEHPGAAALRRDAAASRSSLAHAVELIHAAPDVVTLERLAGHAGVTGRAPQLAFRRHLGTTPTRYLRDVRLDRARDALRDPDDERSVAEVAAAVGLPHRGRFAVAYAARFGEQPSRTATQRRPA